MSVYVQSSSQVEYSDFVFGRVTIAAYFICQIIFITALNILLLFPPHCHDFYFFRFEKHHTYWADSGSLLPNRGLRPPPAGRGAGGHLRPRQGFRSLRHPECVCHLSAGNLSPPGSWVRVRVKVRVSLTLTLILTLT